SGLAGSWRRRLGRHGPRGCPVLPLDQWCDRALVRQGLSLRSAAAISEEIKGLRIRFQVSIEETAGQEANLFVGFPDLLGGPYTALPGSRWPQAAADRGDGAEIDVA